MTTMKPLPDQTIAAKCMECGRVEYRVPYETYYYDRPPTCPNGCTWDDENPPEPPPGEAKPMVPEPALQSINLKVRNEELISHLNNLIRLAEKGELRAMVEVCEWWDGSVECGWWWGTKNTHRYAILGMLTALQHKLLTALDA